MPSGRTVDYLESRDDIQSDRLAYFGVSWGGRLGAIIPAVEPRLRAKDWLDRYLGPVNE